MNELQGLPRELGRYSLVRLLGRGGMGRVLLAHDPVLRRDIAIKLIEPTAVEPESLAEMRFFFHREARMTASLRHPNIVEVLDYSGPHADLLFLACELLDGPTLSAHLEEHGPLAPALVAAIGHEIALALAHAHARGVVHRDLKPENVFWLREGRIVVSDFGLAKAMGESGALGQTLVFGRTSLYGSPAYLAPEQLDGQLGPAVDLHALGAILFELSTGVQAFDGADVEDVLARVQSGERADIPGHLELPTDLVQLVDALLARDPVARPSAEQALERLRALLDTLAVRDPRGVLRDFGAALPSPPPVVSEPTAALPFPAEVRTDDEVATEVAERPSASIEASRVSERPWLSYALAAGLGVAGAVGWSFLDQARPAKPVTVLLRTTEPGVVRIDGGGALTLEREVTLLMAPGPHEFEIVRSSSTERRSVSVIAGTGPVFEL